MENSKVSTKTNVKATKAAKAAKVTANKEGMVVEVQVPASTTKGKSPGRPVNPNSVRQQRLADIEKRKAEGKFGRTGRPVNPESANYKKKMEREARKAEGGVISRGRPVNPDSARQKFLADIAERKANGTYKLGRPKAIKTETEEVKAEANMIEDSEQA